MLVDNGELTIDSWERKFKYLNIGSCMIKAGRDPGSIFWRGKVLIILSLFIILKVSSAACYIH